MVQAAMQAMEISDLAERSLRQLSGGQRQKAFAAMCLAQNTETILLDEPTAFLDIRYQLQLMRLARNLAVQGKAIVIVLHELPLALKYADRVALLQNGKLLASDTPDSLFESGVLNKCFGVEVCRTETEDGKQYYCRL